MINNYNFLFRILISGICGAVIGYERSNRNKGAGIRTHAIVAIASCLIMIISKYGFGDIDGRFDGSRIAAQIVSGIGFLGAGIIFVKNNNVVSGLTTSAGIWGTAGVGMSIGAGLIKFGIEVTVIMLLLQTILHKDGILTKKEGYRYKIYIEIKDNMLEFPDMRTELTKLGIFVEALMVKKINGIIHIEIDALTMGSLNKIKVSEKLLEYSSFISIEIE